MKFINYYLSQNCIYISSQRYKMFGRFNDGCIDISSQKFKLFCRLMV